MSAMERTAVITMLSDAVPLLLVAMLSAVVDMLETILVRLAALLGAVRVTVKFVTAPFVKVAMVGQVTAPLLLVPPPVALTKTVFAGSTSLTTMFEAVEGPRFVMLIV